MNNLTPENIRQTILATPFLLNRIRTEFPQLAAVLNDPNAFATTWQSINASQLLQIPSSTYSMGMPSFSVRLISHNSARINC